MNNSKLNDLCVGEEFPCFIVAEIGQNHQGDIEEAKRLIRLAKEAGVNCVKFQKSCLKERFTKAALDAQYDSENSFGVTYGEHRNHLEFNNEQFLELQKYATENKILFTASPMDQISADLLIKMQVPFIKIGSGDTNNYPLIEYIAKSKIPIFLSTGMQEFSTVERAYKIITKYHSNLVILHCVSSYPTQFSDVNLKIMDLYKERFPGVVIGYSGHERGINVAIAAVAIGAKVIEKHFTSDKKQKGTDHQCSLDPLEMRNLVAGIREVESSLGHTPPVKKIFNCEELCRKKLGKSIVSRRNINKDDKIELDDLAIKVSTPMGIRPEIIYEIIGKKSNENIDADLPLELNSHDKIVLAG